MRWLTYLQQFQANQNKLSAVFFSIIILLTVWLLGAWIWLPLTQTTVTKWTATAVDTAMKENTVDLNSISSAHLFGAEAKVTVQAPSVVNTNAPKTKLDLKLVGLVVSESAENSLAIIASKGSQATYGVGDSIDKSRAKLKAVLSDRVIIDNSGRDETLYLDDDMSPAARNNLVSNRHNQSRSDHSGGDPLDTIKSAIMSEPGQLLNYVSFSELKKSGQVIGYKIKPGRSSLLFDETELEPGDVVTEINGVSLSDTKGLMTLLSDLSQATELNLIVDRNGQQQEIHIQL